MRATDAFHSESTASICKLAIQHLSQAKTILLDTTNSNDAILLAITEAKFLLGELEKRYSTPKRDCSRSGGGSETTERRGPNGPPPQGWDTWEKERFDRGDYDLL